VEEWAWLDALLNLPLDLFGFSLFGLQQVDLQYAVAIRDRHLAGFDFRGQRNGPLNLARAPLSAIVIFILHFGFGFAFSCSSLCMSCNLMSHPEQN
jgi:hypothetical protein